MLNLDETFTQIQSGDTIYWNPRDGYITISRGRAALCWIGSGTKKSVYFKAKEDFLVFLFLVGEMVNLAPTAVEETVMGWSARLV